MLSGAETVMQILFILEILAAFCLLVGYRTRTMNILTWIFVCNPNARKRTKQSGVRGKEREEEAIGELSERDTLFKI